MLLVVAACGAQPAAKPAPAQPPPPIAKREVKPATFSCADVGVILRGHVDDEKQAGPEKEAAIARACLHEKWSTAVIECVTGAAKPRPCLEQLTKEQRIAYQDRMLRWNDTYPDEVIDPDDTPVDPVDDFVDCATAVGDVSRYAPPLTLKGKDKELATAMRRPQILALCEDWSMEVRACFEKAGPVDKCRALLEDDQKRELTDRLAEIDVLMAKVEALQQKPPATIDCKKVVEAHYGNARWKGKLDGFKPKDRKQVIVESRSRMQSACADDKWHASLRACVIAQGGDACFTASGMALAWGYPASGIAIKTGIAECDAYGDVLRALAACTAIPKQAAQTMLDNYGRTISTFANMKPAERTAAANSCKQADSAIRQSAKSLGCTI